MIILHIAALNGDKCSGVNVVVPRHITAQEQIAEVALVNICNIPVEGINNCFTFDLSFDLKKLDRPFDKPDIIVFHEMYHTEFLTIYRQAKRDNIPYVLVPHGGFSVEAQHKKRIKKTLANMLVFNSFFKDASVLHCLNEQERDNLSIKKKTFVCPNGVFVETKKKEVFSNGSLRLLYIGRLEIKIKGIDLLLSAVEQTAEILRKSNLILDIYGPDNNEEKDFIRSEIKNRRINDIVFLHGPVFGEEKQKVLLSADCFIQSSRTEGMPTGLMEALAYALPVIVTEGTGMAESVKSYDMGFACETSVAGIKNALTELVGCADKLKEKGLNGREYIKNSMTWSMVAQTELAEYKKLI